MKEKIIEKQIVNYLRSIWWWCEGLQSWSLMVKKWKNINKVNLCSKWTPDIIWFYDGELIAIEVKKNQKEVDSWIEKEKRYNDTWELPKSYIREVMQIEHKKLILENWGTHIITCNPQEVVDYITNK